MFVCAFIRVFYLNFRPQSRRYVGCLQLDLCQTVLLFSSVQTARVISDLVKRACQNLLRNDFTITYRTENTISFLSYQILSDDTKYRTAGFAVFHGYRNQFYFCFQKLSEQAFGGGGGFFSGRKAGGL
jgi:hypothetical protein